MFISTGKFNEGGIKNKRMELKKREFVEGQNPKVSDLISNTFRGQEAAKENCVNSKWERLRK